MPDDTYGPQTARVEWLFDQFQAASPEKLDAIAASHADLPDDRRLAAVHSVVTVAKIADRHEARLKAVLAALDVVGFASGYDVWNFVGNAVAAIVVADLVGQHGLTPEHLDLFLTPVRDTFGPIPGLDPENLL
jgi:hypothetical protein